MSNDIVNEIQKEYPIQNNNKGVFAEDVYDAFSKIEKIIKNFDSCDNIKIKNIALDMSFTLPKLENFIKKYYFKKNGIYQGLIINSKKLKKNNIKIQKIWKNNIKMQSDNFKLFIEKNKNVLANKNFNLEIRKNNSIPFFHGFLINDEHLILSLLEVDDDNYIDGGDSCYHYYTNKDETGKYYIKIYKQWFKYFWENSDEI